jgi:energy-coupling factor transport system permease protein
MADIPRIDPRAKITFFITIFTMIFLSRDLFFILILTGLVLGIALTYRRSRKSMLPGLVKMAPMLIVAFILWSVLYKWSLFYSYNNSGVMIDVGIFMTARLFLILLTSLLFISIISPRELITALEGFRLPYKVVFTLGLTMRHISTFSKEYLVIKEAQTSRGLELDKGFLVKRIKNYIPVIIPLLIRSIENAEKLSLAMDLKLFSFANRRHYTHSKLGSKDKIIIIISILALIITITHFTLKLI